MRHRVSGLRRALAAGVAVLCVWLCAQPLQEAARANASLDQALRAGRKAAISLDIGALFGSRRAGKSGAGRVLVPGGQAVGVAVSTAGALVVGVGEGAAQRAGLRAGDVLLTVNGVPITDAQVLTGAVNGAQGQPVTLLYARDGKTGTLLVAPQPDDAGKAWRLGVWVRDSTAGVGTLTYYDPSAGTYGALGHAITDGDTGSTLPVRQGDLLKADIVDVRRGARGTPGELKGSFLREQVLLGNVERNTVYGIYGAMDNSPDNALYPDGLPAAARGEVRTGPASILSTVDGGGIAEYAVEIVQLTRQNAPAQKSMVLRVTDQRLLALTGGIVQGMSGSPIIQDGKIVGAVTHVFVSDPAQGYGVYIEWMLEQSDAAASAQKKAG